MLSRIASASSRVLQSSLVKNRVLASAYSTKAPPTPKVNLDEEFVDPTIKYREKYELGLLNVAPTCGTIEHVTVESIDELKDDESLADQLRVRFGENMPTIEDDNKPERDIVNFPRYKTPEYQEATKYIVIPKSWFDFFYEKTGVSGPHVLTAGLLTFLLSKEWLIIEHEMVVGGGLFVIAAYVTKTYGKQLSDYLEDLNATEEKSWDAYQHGSIELLQRYIELEKKHQNSLTGQSILFDAKRENVHLQREGEYRRRLMAVHNEVKRKLDYQIATQLASKQFAQKHMVNWIIDSVTKGISAQQEKEALTKCIIDLKALSTKRANVI